jgi:hypothetical protein
LSFPEGATGHSLGALISGQDGGAYVTGAFSVLVPEATGLENTKVASAAFGFEVQSLTPEVSLCPTAGASYSWVEDFNQLTVPFGVGIGGTLALTPRGNAGLTPFVVPQFLYVRQTVDGVRAAASEVFVGVTAGVTLHVNAFFLTGELGRIFEEGRDPVFSVGVGAAWR